MPKKPILFQCILLLTEKVAGKAKNNEVDICNLGGSYNMSQMESETMSAKLERLRTKIVELRAVIQSPTS